MEPRKKNGEVVLAGLWVLFSLLLALCASCLLCALLYFNQHSKPPIGITNVFCIGGRPAAS